MRRKVCNKDTEKSLDEMAVDTSIRNVMNFTYSTQTDFSNEIARYQRMAEYTREMLHPEILIIKQREKNIKIPLKPSIDRRTKENDKYLQPILYRTGTLLTSLYQKLTDEQREADFQTEEMQKCKETLEGISFYLSGDIK